MRNLGRLTCLSLLPLLAAVAAHGAVTFTARLGFEGKAPATGWCPVLVDLRNDGEAVNARLSIPPDAGASADPHGGMLAGTTLVCSRNLQLPAYGRVRCFLYIPTTNGINSIGLQVGSQSQTISLPSLAHESRSRTTVVVGGGSERLLQELDGLPVQPSEDESRTSSSPLFSISHVPWSDLPDQWLGWSGVSAVVLADRQWALASTEARQALIQWVRLGGTLIVPGGALVAAYAPDLREVLPLQANSLNPQGSIAAVGRWLGQTAPPPPVMLATGPLRAGSGTLCAAGGQPLVVTAPLGSGEIIMPAFDYTEPQMGQWTLRADLWGRLIRKWPADPVNIGPGSLPSSMGGLVQLAGSMPQARRLPWRAMVLYLLVYVALLGPAQFLLMRRRGQRWSWLLTLGIIAFFTVNAFVVGTALRGRRVIVYRASSVEARSGESVGNGVGAVGLFSPGRGSYSFTTPPAEIGLGLRDYLSPLTQAPRLAEDSPWLLETGPTPMWTLKIAQAAFLADLGQGVQARAVWNGQSLQVRVTNRTGLTFSQLQVLADERRAETDQTLAPGQTLDLSYDHNARPDRPPDSRWMRDVAYGFPPAATVKPTDLAQELMRRARGAQEAAIDLDAANPVLLAVTTDPVAPLTLTDRRAQVQDVTLVRVPLRVTLPQGATADIPSWLVEKRSLLPDSDGSRLMSTGKLTRHLLEYRVPVGPLGATPVSLTFVMPVQPGTAREYGGPDDAETLTATDVAAFNFQTGSWQALPRDLGRWRVPTPEQFLTSDGRLQLSYRLPDQLPAQMRHGSQEMNTTLEPKAVLRAW